MIVGVQIVLIFSFLITGSIQMWCLDGADCENYDTCALCEGAACLRVQRINSQKGVTVALTCLPHDSLIHVFHPEGCRTELATGEKLCLCSSKDFCNSTSNFNILISVFLSCFFNFVKI